VTVTSVWTTHQTFPKIIQSNLDPIPARDFNNARKKANPYEGIGKQIFQNRAAVKMANLDHLFDLTYSADKVLTTFHFCFTFSILRTQIQFANFCTIEILLFALSF
jgi:hypothetical protein